MDQRQYSSDYLIEMKDSLIFLT